ncbi:GNAT family N-acetyltransferase [Acuticoccus sp. M5D2P5]|uniref:GNAT family N-acetyltransferase n=1 Tax=Acuticoccus kalidii TaxID=2910977 RepID=UPI001F25DDE4|nr:GNAT family N-acetyltransferase [Acuticoccus kalidii]MCF3936761.1 GNAT family N-acetyltransferase [Acuticoccus kalidii]
MPRVEEATFADASAVARVLRASIAALCDADHENRRDLIERWSGNKTHEQAIAWIQDPKTIVLVSRAGSEIAAVGACGEGRILLNYVAPEHRFEGHSKALLRRMEEILRQKGTTCARLTSTITAHRFYSAAGWHDEGQPETSDGDLVGYPMAKDLDA